MRGLVGLALSVCLLASLPADESLIDGARARRDQATADLVAARQRIADERQALLAAMTIARKELDAVETELATASRDRQELVAGLAALEAARHTDRPAVDLALARQLLELAVVPVGDPVRLAAALETAVDARLARLDGCNSVRLTQVELFDRAGLPGRVPVVQLGKAQRIAAGDDSTRMGLVHDGGTEATIGGPALDTEQRAILQATVAGRGLLLPLDVSGGLAARPSPTPWSFARWFAAGGLFMWPILVVGLAALLTILERATVFLRLRTRPALAERFFTALEHGDRATALALVAATSTPQRRLLRTGGDNLDLPPSERDGHLEATLITEAGIFERGLGLLAAFAAIAPLLGLLGTVSGMVFSFDVLAKQGGSDPQALSGGIAVAMTTTQFGLIVAVPIVLAHAILRRRCTRQLALLEAQASRFATLVPIDHASTNPGPVSP